MIIKSNFYPMITNFDFIEFHNLVFTIDNSDYIAIDNNNKKTNLLIKDCVINSSELINTKSNF